MDFDPTFRVLRVSVVGVVTDEILEKADAAVRRFLAEEGADFGVFDYTCVTSVRVTSEYVRRIAHNKPASPQMKLRIAIAPQPALYGMNRMYEFLIDERRSDFQIVRTMKEAAAIIGHEPIDFSRKVVPK